MLELLAQLRAEQPATLGLLTGNYAETGALKLRAAGIDPEWFAIGAWGDMAAERHALVPVALAQLAQAPPPEHVIIVGDTVRDVECAQKNGCACIAVASGGSSASELVAAGRGRSARGSARSERALANAGLVGLTAAPRTARRSPAHGYVHAMKAWRSLAAGAVALGLTCGSVCSGCGGSAADMKAGNGANDRDASDGPQPRDDETVPPIEDRGALTAWLARKYYLNWTCEAAPHASRSAVHSRLRVCRNDALEHPPASGEYHVSAAAVAELFDASDSLIGHAALARVLPDPRAKGWYFYERFTPSAAAALLLTLEPDGTLADGPGDAGGNAQTLCAGCHAGAARDFVYGANGATQ